MKTRCKACKCESNGIVNEKLHQSENGCRAESGKGNGSGVSKSI